MPLPLLSCCNVTVPVQMGPFISDVGIHGGGAGGDNIHFINESLSTSSHLIPLSKHFQTRLREPFEKQAERLKVAKEDRPHHLILNSKDLVVLDQPGP